MELFIHTQGEEGPKLIEVDEFLTVREIVEMHFEPGGLVWIEDAELALEETVTIEAAQIGHHGHIHVGHCRNVSVQVRFGGSNITREFPPPTRVARVFEWAVGPEGFNLPADQRPEHDLIVCGGDHPISPSVHVGSLASKECAVCFDLAAKHNPQG